jgi:hypothetical protein
MNQRMGLRAGGGCTNAIAYSQYSANGNLFQAVTERSSVGHHAIGCNCRTFFIHFASNLPSGREVETRLESRLRVPSTIPRSNLAQRKEPSVSIFGNVLLTSVWCSSFWSC